MEYFVDVLRENLFQKLSMDYQCCKIQSSRYDHLQ